LLGGAKPGFSVTPGCSPVCCWPPCSGSPRGSAAPTSVSTGPSVPALPLSSSSGPSNPSFPTPLVLPLATTIGPTIEDVYLLLIGNPAVVGAAAEG